MSARGRSHLYTRATIFTLLSGAALFPIAAQAQTPVSAESEAQTSGASDIGDIIVTAQRRSERLQDVPIAISAVDGEQLAARSVNDLQALSGAVPGLFISGAAGSNGTNLIAIRGVSGQPLPIGASQATAVYLDGVYLSRPDAAFFTLDDVERVEVLRGPQGTLYGRNATAGAINIVTRDPGDTLRGGADVSYGNYDAINAKGSLSGPLGGGFSAGISGSYGRHDNYFTNSVTNQPFKDNVSHTIRGKIRYESPDNQFSAILSGDTSRVESVAPFQNIYSLTTGAYIGLGDPYVVEMDAPSQARAIVKVRSEGGSLTANLAASDHIDLTWVSSYRYFSNLTNTDIDGTALPAILSQADNRVKTYTSELRGVLHYSGFRLTGGANWYYEDQYFGFGSAAATLPGNTSSPVDKSKLEAVAVFGQAEFDLTDQLTLVGGLRFNHESRNYSNDYRAANGPLFVGKIADSVLIPSFGVNFQATPDLLLYAKFSRGYQAPGFNMAPGFTAGQGPNTIARGNEFDAEKLDAYEAGVKSQFFDRRVTFNAAVFHYKYSNIQVRATTGPGVVTISNAASAKIDGFEATLSATPVSGLTISGNITYLNARYGSYCELVQPGSPLNGDATCSGPNPALVYADRSGNRLNQAPEWQGGGTIGYTRPIADFGVLRASVSYTGISSVYYTSANENVIASGKVSKLDARLGFELHNGPELYVYGTNLTKNYYIDQGLRGSPALAPVHVSDPRTYGIGLKYHF